MYVRPTLTSTSSSSYAQFLEQLSNEEFWKLAVEAVRPIASAPALPDLTATSTDYLECVLEHGRCIFPLVILREIVSPPLHFSHFPASPSWMIGIGAWRSETIPVVDLDAYLLKDTARMFNASSNGLLLVVQHETLTLGLLVSSVEFTTNVEVEQIAPFAYVAERYAYARSDVILGVRRDNESGEKQKEPGTESLVLDLPVIFADIVQNIKNDHLL